MIIKINKTLNNNKWAAYNSEWGVASGRISTLLWDTKEEVEEWIKNNKPSSGKYSPIPWVIPIDLVGAEIIL